MSASPFGQGAIITALRGQTLHVPNLSSIFFSWPEPSLNKHYQALVPVVNQAILDIDAAVPHLNIQRRLHDDIALLACLWFPTTRRPEIDAIVLYAVWLMCWDDTVDANEGDLAGDFAKAEEWRGRTLEVVRVALGLAAANRTEGLDAINTVLLDFGRRFTDGGASLADRWRMFEQVAIFIRACAIEQEMRLGESMPSYDTYMAFREGTVGGGTLCALVPFAMNRDVPSGIADSRQTEVLQKQTNIMLSLINDLLSLKKELMTDCVINAVATLFTPETPLDEVVSQIYDRICLAVHTFDEAAGELIDSTIHDDDLQNLTRDFIDGYRAIVTGTLEFMLKSPRYSISQLLHEDGSLEIVL